MNKISLSVSEADAVLVKELLELLGSKANNRMEVILNTSEPLNSKCVQSYIKGKCDICSCDECKDGVATDSEVKLYITKMLKEIGIPPNILGFQYLRDGIYMVYQNRNMLSALKKELYEEIARINATESTRVERAIRHAVEVMWNKDRSVKAEEVFSYKFMNGGKKPNSSEFIAVLADQLMLEWNCR